MKIPPARAGGISLCCTFDQIATACDSGLARLRRRIFSRTVEK
jgi:hypothetical protein